MKVEALDKKMTFSMFVKGIGNKLKSIMAKTISPEEKLKLIENEMSQDVHSKRVTARTIRAKMVALADPDTAQLEPLERLRARREKLVALGAKVLKEQEEAVAASNQGVVKEKTAELKKITKEVKSLDPSLASLETTYETLKESYEVALENYKVALAAYDHVKNNGSTLLFAIKAHQEALQVKDNAKTGTTVDASFLDELEGELTKAQQELRSDNQLDKELDTDEPSVLESQEQADAEQSILDEFRSKK